MYKIIGADQREYGPVVADQIREWIAEGRANGQTKAWDQGAANWKPLSDFPEFTEALASKAHPASPPLLSPPVVGERNAWAAQPAAFMIGDCFSRSWQLYKDNFWLFFGATAVVVMITLGLRSVPWLGWLGIGALEFVFWGGLYSMYLKRIRGNSADVGDAFVGFSKFFVPLMLASLLAHVLTVAGFILLILPGIYLLVAWWMFVPLLIIDKRLDFWDAMEKSRTTVNRNWWPCCGLFFLAVLVFVAGLLACIIGVLFTLPIAIAAIVFAYEDLFGERKEIAVAVAPMPAPTKPAGEEGASGIQPSSTGNAATSNLSEPSKDKQNGSEAPRSEA